MKTKSFRQLLIIPLYLIALLPAKAGSFWGADISWRQIAKDTCIVTVNFYRDCNGTPITGTEQLLVKGGAKDSVYDMTQTYVANITPVCKKSCSRCGSTPNTTNSSCSFVYGFEKYRLTAKVVIDTTKCNYTFSWSGYAYNYLIQTIDYPNRGLSVKATWNRCYGKDNSPQMYSNPLTLVYQNKLTEYNPYAVDSDVSSRGLSDSLSYKLITPTDFNGNLHIYVSPYAYNKPLKFDSFPNINAKWNPPSGAGFHFDSTNGNLFFTATSKMITVMAFSIDEWRKDSTGKSVKIGEIQRAMAFSVNYFSGNNHTPVISGINGTNITDTVICAGTTYSAEILCDDVDVKDTVSYSYDARLLPKGFKFNAETGKKHPRFYLSWKPDTTYIGKAPFHLNLTVSDDACPINASASKTYSFKVIPAFRDTVQANNNCGTVTFKAMGKSGTTLTKYFWSGDDSLVDSVATFTHQYTKSGSYKYKVSAFNAAGCSKTDSGIVVINIPPVPAIMATGLDSLTAVGAGIKYRWLKDSILLADSGKYLYPAASGKYLVQMVDSQGCYSSFSSPLAFTYTSIQSSKAMGLVKINPNPTTGYVIIEAPGIPEGTISLSTSEGREILNVPFNYRKELNLQYLPKGTYIMMLRSKNVVSIQKLIFE